MLGLERKIDFSLTSKSYSTARRVEGDEEIAKSLIYDVCVFLMHNSYEMLNSYHKSSSKYCKIGETRDLKVRCKKGRQLIETHLQLFVVDTDMNYHEQSGLNLFVWERTINLQERNTLSCLTTWDFQQLQLTERDSIKILTISKNSFDALCRFQKTLEARTREEAKARRKAKALREERAREKAKASWEAGAPEREMARKRRERARQKEKERMSKPLTSKQKKELRKWEKARQKEQERLIKKEKKEQKEIFRSLKLRTWSEEERDMIKELESENEMPLCCTLY